jgi:hypothetical protein
VSGGHETRPRMQAARQPAPSLQGDPAPNQTVHLAVAKYATAPRQWVDTNKSGNAGSGDGKRTSDNPNYIVTKMPMEVSAHMATTMQKQCRGLAGAIDGIPTSPGLSPPPYFDPEPTDTDSTAVFGSIVGLIVFTISGRLLEWIFVARQAAESATPNCENASHQRRFSHASRSPSGEHEGIQGLRGSRLRNRRTRVHAQGDRGIGDGVAAPRK